MENQTVTSTVEEYTNLVRCQTLVAMMAQCDSVYLKELLDSFLKAGNRHKKKTGSLLDMEDEDDE